MQIKTIYTKERLLNYQMAVMRMRKAMWMYLAVCTVIVLVCYGLLAVVNAVTSTMTLCLILVLVVDATMLFAGLVLPRFTISKAKNLNTEITYTFTEEHFQTEAVNVHMTESTTIQYSILQNVQKQGTELYLFITRRQAYIVDLSQTSCEEQQALKELLQRKVPIKSFKWQ